MFHLAYTDAPECRSAARLASRADVKVTGACAEPGAVADSSQICRRRLHASAASCGPSNRRAGGCVTQNVCATADAIASRSPTELCISTPDVPRRRRVTVRQDAASRPAQTPRLGSQDTASQFAKTLRLSLSGCRVSVRQDASSQFVRMQRLSSPRRFVPVCQDAASQFAKTLRPVCQDAASQFAKSPGASPRSSVWGDEFIGTQTHLPQKN